MSATLHSTASRTCSRRCAHPPFVECRVCVCETPRLINEIGRTICVSFVLVEEGKHTRREGEGRAAFTCHTHCVLWKLPFALVTAKPALTPTHRLHTFPSTTAHGTSRAHWFFTLPSNPPPLARTLANLRTRAVTVTTTVADQFRTIQTRSAAVAIAHPRNALAVQCAVSRTHSFRTRQACKSRLTNAVSVDTSSVSRTFCRQILVYWVTPKWTLDVLAIDASKALVALALAQHTLSSE